MVVQPDDAGGLTLAPLTEESEAFAVEYVPDPVAEGAPLGLALDAGGGVLVYSPASLAVRSLNLAYRVARYVDDHGVRVAQEKVQSVVRARAARRRRSTSGPRVG